MTPIDDLTLQILVWSIIGGFTGLMIWWGCFDHDWTFPKTKGEDRL